jgi:hypothetical protein
MLKSPDRLVSGVDVRLPAEFIHVPIIATVNPPTGFIGWAWIDRAERGERIRIVDPFEGEGKIFELFKISALLCTAELLAQNRHSPVVPDGTQRLDKSVGKTVEAVAVVLQSCAQNRHRSRIANFSQLPDDTAKLSFLLAADKMPNSFVPDVTVLTNVLIDEEDQPVKQFVNSLRSALIQIQRYHGSNLACFVGQWRVSRC